MFAYVLFFLILLNLMQHLDCGMDLLRQRYHHHPEWFRSTRIDFLDTLLQRLWCAKYDLFVNQGLMPPGAYDYHNGTLPVFLPSGKIWGLDIDDIYCPLHVKGDHWVAMWISIPRRHITIWDCKKKHARDSEIEVCVKPIQHIMPAILNQLAPAEVRSKYPLTPFTYERPTEGIPQNDKVGDCGVYCLKYIEFHSLGMEWPDYFCDKHVKTMRDKLATDIFHELKRNGTEKRTGLEWELLDMYEQGNEGNKGNEGDEGNESKEVK